MFVDAKAIDYFTNEVLLAKVDGEVDTVSSALYKVSGYPTSVLLGADGKEIDRVIGYAPTDEFLGAITNYRNGIGTLDDLLNKAQGSSDRALFFEIADKYKYRGGSEEAETWYNKIVAAGQPTDSMSGEARSALANMYYRAKQYDDAMAAYRSVKADFGPDMFGQNADKWRAIIYRKQADTTQAIAAFEQFIKDYPESEDVEYAQGQIAKLKGEEETE